MLIEAAMICSGLWMSNRHDWILEYHEHLGSPLRYANICCVISAIILNLLHGFFVFQRYEIWYADRVLTALAFSQYPSYLMLLMFGLLPFKYSIVSGLRVRETFLSLDEHGRKSTLIEKETKPAIHSLCVVLPDKHRLWHASR